MHNILLALKNKLKSNSAQTAIGNLFVFLFITIILLLIMRAVEFFAIVKNSRDSLERAALSVAAVNEYRLYGNFRENVINDDELPNLITSDEVINVLTNELSMQSKDGEVYKMRGDNSGYYYMLSDITANAVIEKNANIDRYKIETSAVLYIPINFMGFQDMEFPINVSCVYASKLNAER